MSREYFEQTKPNLKTFLLERGYEGAGEAEFDAIMKDVRGSTAAMLAPPAKGHRGLNGNVHAR